MAQPHSTPNTRSLAPRFESRSVEVRFYAYPHDDHPSYVLIDGAVYDRSRDQEKSLATCRQDAAEADLMVLVPLADRDAARGFLVAMSDARSDWHMADRDHIEATLVELLPQHRPVINHAFCPDDSDMRLDEAVRHMHCTLAPAAQEEAQ